MPGLAFVFPGQGSQAVGMGVELGQRSPAAARTFVEADQALGFALSTLMRDGPADVLGLTENAQPAILTVAVAAWRAFTALRSSRAIAAAGHSLGEYAALVAAGVMQFEDAVRAVHARGRLMQQAVPVGEGAMAAVISLAPEKILEVLAGLSPEAGPVTVAGFNSPEQTTISGAKAAVEAASKALTAAGARRVLPLKVSAPFHCPLMQPVAAPLSKVLEPMPLGGFAMPVVSNVEAQANVDPTRVKPLLIEQLTRPVRWVESIQCMRAMGANGFVELGAGKTLAGMIKKIDPTLGTWSIENSASFDLALAELS